MKLQESVVYWASCMLGEKGRNSEPDTTTHPLPDDLFQSWWPPVGAEGILFLLFSCADCRESCLFNSDEKLDVLIKVVLQSCSIFLLQYYVYLLMEEILSMLIYIDNARVVDKFLYFQCTWLLILRYMWLITEISIYELGVYCTLNPS